MVKSTLLLCLLLCVFGCEQKNSFSEPLNAVNGDRLQSVSASDADVPAVKKEASKYLAYVHHMSVEFDSDELASTHKSITNACEKDIQFSCTILSDNYSSGEYSSGRIQLRVAPEGVAFFSGLASQKGELATQSRVAEDLSLSILDTAKRIEQLQRFEQKLIALESRADADIDSLLKVASQLAETQTQLEYLQGAKAVLMQRVQTDILNINLKLKYEQSFLKSIGNAFSGFGEELTYAIEGLINSIAYIVPWSLFLMIMFFVLRGLYRLLNGKVFRRKKSSN